MLALQGAFSEHVDALRTLGVRTCEVRTAEELAGLDGLIMPGGESTAMHLIAKVRRHVVLEMTIARQPVADLARRFGNCLCSTSRDSGPTWRESRTGRCVRGLRGILLRGPALTDPRHHRHPQPAGGGSCAAVAKKNVAILAGLHDWVRCISPACLPACLPGPSRDDRMCASSFLQVRVRKMPTWGTCAGLILLADRLVGAAKGGYVARPCAPCSLTIHGRANPPRLGFPSFPTAEPGATTREFVAWSHATNWFCSWKTRKS